MNVFNYNKLIGFASYNILKVVGVQVYSSGVFLCFRFLRVDTLSLLLSMANVSANSDVLVVDMLGGLLTGAVAERLGGLSTSTLICMFNVLDV